MKHFVISTLSVGLLVNCALQNTSVENNRTNQGRGASASAEGQGPGDQNNGGNNPANNPLELEKRQRMLAQLTKGYEEIKTLNLVGPGVQTLFEQLLAKLVSEDVKSEDFDKIAELLFSLFDWVKTTDASLAAEQTNGINVQAALDAKSAELAALAQALEALLGDFAAIGGDSLGAKIKAVVDYLMSHGEQLAADVLEAQGLTQNGSALASLTIGSVAALPVGAERRLAVVGTYTDGGTKNLTSYVSFNSSGNGLAVENGGADHGVVRGTNQGTYTVTAALFTISQSIEIVVTAPELVSLTLAPGEEGPYVAGEPLQLVATGTYSDGTSEQVTSAATWLVTSTNIGYIINNADNDADLPIGTLLSWASGSVAVIANVKAGERVVSAATTVAMVDPVVTGLFEIGGYTPPSYCYILYRARNLADPGFYSGGYPSEEPVENDERIFIDQPVLQGLQTSNTACEVHPYDRSTLVMEVLTEPAAGGVEANLQLDEHHQFTLTFKAAGHYELKFSEPAYSGFAVTVPYDVLQNELVLLRFDWDEAGERPSECWREFDGGDGGGPKDGFQRGPFTGDPIEYSLSGLMLDCSPWVANLDELTIAVFDTINQVAVTDFTAVLTEDGRHLALTFNVPGEFQITVTANNLSVSTTTTIHEVFTRYMSPLDFQSSGQFEMDCRPNDGGKNDQFFVGQKITIGVYQYNTKDCELNDVAASVTFNVVGLDLVAAPNEFVITQTAMRITILDAAESVVLDFDLFAADGGSSAGMTAGDTTTGGSDAVGSDAGGSDAVGSDAGGSDTSGTSGDGSGSGGETGSASDGSGGGSDVNSSSGTGGDGSSDGGGTYDSGSGTGGPIK